MDTAPGAFSCYITIVMQIKKQGHCAYQCEYHLILVTKYRRKIFNMGSFEHFKEITRVIRASLPEIEFFTMNHDEDHIQLHLSIPPKMKVSDVVRTNKSISGRQLKRKFDYMRKAYWGIDGIWSDGYFVSTIGIDEKVLTGYIERQGREDAGQA